ncbi:ABC transporter permease [Pseudorhodobacter sp.]|uniref:ABC transporter permease n=1 Tax=Pseudorhodobacter sp. TaxID=1934400 RepID=UPI002AFF0025|nr:ABC transporter permease [Pseudorhodobacter sp.]
MFQRQTRKNPVSTAFGMLELIFHATVRNVRKNHGNPVIGLMLNILQTVMLVAVFYLLFKVLGMRRNAIRGDYLLYVMSGIFMYMTHIKALSAVSSCDGPTSPMMKHAPMNTLVAISAAALSSLYTQVLSATVVLYVYHAAFQPIEFHNFPGTLGMLLLSWSSGAAIGTILLAAKPWQPDAVNIVAQLYQRANMIASGKMFVANAMPSSKLVLFDWNPLFHTIDQGRGFIFLNYHPHYSSSTYPLKVTLVLFVIGLMAENFTRKHASVSWGAKH